MSLEEIRFPFSSPFLSLPRPPLPILVLTTTNSPSLFSEKVLWCSIMVLKLENPEFRDLVLEGIDEGRKRLGGF